ncbi:PEP-CTERM sorting domain-containing protein [Poseidonocella sedimentorum]|uniref:PEP-CTERM sorting domain-containing protein n=1 Tax=Poseidonocella sedimentorum TaxID=871652 RepID=UPI001160CE96|nr:PEP-CTERM sorting domain-containing protein [Poseidonocella sedimentorum]
MRRFTERLALPAIAALGIAGGASAATLDSVAISATPFYTSPDLLDVVAGDDGSGNKSFEAIDLALFQMGAYLDYDDADESILAASDPFDFFVDESGALAEGSALDFAFDAVGDTMRILYDLSVNSFTADEFAVVHLIFDSGVIGSMTDIGSLDGELVGAVVYGANAATVIPLPATLPLALAGLGGLAFAGRRASRPLGRS